MIYVTSGLDQGIGLEIFFKALSCFTHSIDQFILITSKDDAIRTLNSIGFSYTINSDSLIFNGNRLKTIFHEKTQVSKSVDYINHALAHIKEEDILLTLPSSKAEFNQFKTNVNGHTDFLREKFPECNITMNFLSDSDSVMLLTEHIALCDVTKTLNHDFIKNKIVTTLDNWPIKDQIKEVYLCGINPHCGEGGLIGLGDDILVEVAKDLALDYQKIKFIHSVAADTAHINHKGPHQLFIYPFHDQGLTGFKQKNGTIGINLSLGLPFYRVSVDHGTAPSIYGKNLANYQGMLYLLDQIENWQKKTRA